MRGPPAVILLPASRALTLVSELEGEIPARSEGDPDGNVGPRRPVVVVVMMRGLVVLTVPIQVYPNVNQPNAEHGEQLVKEPPEAVGVLHQLVAPDLHVSAASVEGQCLSPCSRLHVRLQSMQESPAPLEFLVEGFEVSREVQSPALC